MRLDLPTRAFLPGFYIEPGPDTPPALRLEIERMRAALVLPLPQPKNALRLFLSRGLLKGLRYPTRGQLDAADRAAREALYVEAAVSKGHVRGIHHWPARFLRKARLRG